MVEQKYCFVLSPIGDPDGDIRGEADWVLHHMIKPALEPTFRVERADHFTKTNAITNQVITAIRKADLIVADLTDFNPNVFYELAVAHAYKRPVVPLKRDDGRPIPFDNAPMGTIFYTRARVEKWEAAKVELKRSALAAIEPNHVVSNPITMALGFEEVQAKGDETSKMLANMADQIASLTRRFEMQERIQPAAFNPNEPRSFQFVSRLPSNGEKIGYYLSQPAAGTFITFASPTPLPLEEASRYAVYNDSADKGGNPDKDKDK
jgi:hypothetical protein